MLCMITLQGTWQKEAEEPLPSANGMIDHELPIARYFKTDTDSDVILILSTFLRHTSPCAVDVTIVNSEYADAYEITVYWNRTAILLKVKINATNRKATHASHRTLTLLRILL